MLSGVRQSTSGSRQAGPPRAGSDHRTVQAVATDPAARERELNSLSTLTVIVVMAIVTMAFGAMIGVFFYRSAAPKFWGHLSIPYLLWLTTGVLIASSV